MDIVTKDRIHTAGRSHRSCVTTCRTGAVLGMLLALPTLASELEITGPPLEVLRLANGARIALAANSAGVVTGDVDADRRVELFLASKAGGIFVGRQNEGVHPFLPDLHATALVLADLYGDGRPELIFATAADRIMALDFESEEIRLLRGVGPRSLAAGDVDGDGLDEVVAVLGDGSVVVVDPKELQLLDIDLPATSVAAGDFLGPGKVAIAVLLASGDLVLAQFGGQVSVLHFPAAILALASGDLDGDGVDELVMLDVSGGLFRLQDPFGEEPLHRAWLGDVVYREPAPALAVLSAGSVSTGLFRRGDSNDSGDADISDAVFTLGCLFLGTPCPGCRDAADANDDGEVDISDASYLLQWLFIGGPAIPVPGAAHCGEDATPDLLGGCHYEHC